MTPADFKEANIRFCRPAEMTEGQCKDVLGYQGEITGGDLDGTPIIVTAWRPSAEEVQQLIAGAPVYLVLFANQLPPHSITTRFPIE